MGRVTHYDTVQMLTYLHSYRENVAKYYVTVTASQTHTIQLLGIAAGKSAVVSWGDGLSNRYTGTARRTHVYASAGTYEVKIYTPENVMAFDLRDGAAVSVLNSVDIETMVNVSTFTLVTLPNVTGTFNSADTVDWRPHTFYLYNLPNANITLNSADLVDWRPSTFILYNLPSATITIAPSSIKNWDALVELQLRPGNLTQAQVDLGLWECYQIVRTKTGGKIDMTIAGNAAPSGTFQPCQSPPVSATTPGKEIAYELLNDSLGKGFNKWTDVTTN